MALPPNYQTVRVHGEYLNLDGQPSVGTVLFTPRVRGDLLLDADGVAIKPVALLATLDETGSFEIQLPATDDPDIVPTAWTYLVTVTVDGRTPPSRFDISVPLAGGDIDLNTVTPSAPVTAMAKFVRSVNGVLPDETGNVEVSGGGGSVSWASITGKPTTFTPSAHTHAVADVSGLQAALDALVSGAELDAALLPYATQASMLSAIDGAVDSLSADIATKQDAGSYVTVTELDGVIGPLESADTALDGRMDAAEVAIAGKQPAGSYATSAQHSALATNVVALRAFHVMDYGAVGNGSTNDTAAIQAAIDAASTAGGGSVTLPRGKTFKVVPTLHGRALTAKANVTITGGGTLKVGSGNAKYVTLIGHDSANDVSGFKLIGIEVDQDGMNNMLTANTVVTDEYNFILQVQKGTGFEVSGCTFSNVEGINTLVFNGGVTSGAYNVSGVLVANNHFLNVGASNKHDQSTIYTNCEDVRVLGNQFTGRLIAGACAPSAVCAIELHGSATVCTGNAIKNYRDGVNATAASYANAGTVIANNTMRRALRGISLFSTLQNGGAEPGVEGVTVTGNSMLLDPDFWASTWTVQCRGISLITVDNNAVRGVVVANNVVRALAYTGSNTTVASLNSGGFVYLRSGTVTNIDREVSVTGNVFQGCPGPGVSVTGAYVNGLQIENNQIVDCGHSAIATPEYTGGVYVSGSAKQATVKDNSIYDTRGSTGPMLRGVVWLADSTSTDGAIVDNRITLTNTTNARQVQIGNSSGAPLVQHTCTGGTNTTAPAPTGAAGVGGVEVGSTWTIRASGSRTTQTAFPSGTTWA